MKDVVCEPEMVSPWAFAAVMMVHMVQFPFWCYMLLFVVMRWPPIHSSELHSFYIAV